MKSGVDFERHGPTPAISISPRLEGRRNQFLKMVSTKGEVRGEDSDIAADRKVWVRRRRMGIDITWVTDRIGVGGGIWNAENMGAVARAGVTHIIDMQIEFDDTPLAQEHGIAVCWNPIDDDFQPKPAEVFERGVSFGLAALRDNDSKIFVHCAAGVHRAPMMTLALMRVMGWNLEDALELIEGRRPIADFADVYVRSVEDFLQGRE